MERPDGGLAALPVLDAITAMQMTWQQELHQKYPRLAEEGRSLEQDGSHSTSFKTYLQAELQTYSEHTLSLLHADMRACRSRRKNWNEQILLASIEYQRLAEAGRLP
ncbi:MAG: DUF4125 family protein, partial [Deltaproteobacteria bacterium]|nr:DUF4125 family protein [Deltaproteobacteria bacterium]